MTDRGVVALAIRPNPRDGRNLDDPAYDRLYATVQELEALRAMRRELSNQLTSAANRRNQLAEQLKGADGATRAGEEGVTRVRANTVHGNVVGVALYPTAHGRFSANSFVDNQVQVLPKGGTTAGRSEWSEGAWGNYWSTYRGYESSALPGHGAVPHGEGGGIERLLVRHRKQVDLQRVRAARRVDVDAAVHDDAAPHLDAQCEERRGRDQHGPRAPDDPGRHGDDGPLDGPRGGLADGRARALGS